MQASRYDKELTYGVGMYHKPSDLSVKREKKTIAELAMIKIGLANLSLWFIYRYPNTIPINS